MIDFLKNLQLKKSPGVLLFALVLTIGVGYAYFQGMVTFPVASGFLLAALGAPALVGLKHPADRTTLKAPKVKPPKTVEEKREEANEKDTDPPPPPPPSSPEGTP